MSNWDNKHEIHSWDDAARIFLNKRRNSEGNISLGYATQLVRSGPDNFAIRHHETNVLTFCHDGSVIIDGTWVSRTTANRLHTFRPTFVKFVTSTIRPKTTGDRYYTVQMSNPHPGNFDIDEGESYRIWSDHTVVKM